MNDGSTIEEAEALPFADLARTIRAYLGRSFSALEIENSKEGIRTWIEILESKIPRPPEKPQMIELPEPPVIPSEPVVEEPPQSPSPRYEAVRAHYARLIGELMAQMNGLGKKKRKPIKRKIGELQGEQQKALFEAKVSDLPKEVAGKWLAQRAEHQQWQALKQRLLGDHAVRVKNTERQNKERRGNWSSRMPAPKASRGHQGSAGQVGRRADFILLGIQVSGLFRISTFGIRIFPVRHRHHALLRHLIGGLASLLACATCGR